MSMTAEERKAIVSYRLERADSTFSDTQKLIELGMCATAANRLYYSFYYAASALLISKALITHTHAGLQTMMHLHFVKTQSLSYEEGALMRRLFTLRQESDYDDFIDISEEEIRSLLPMTRNLIDKIKTLI